MRDRTKLNLTNRIVALVLAVVWLVAGSVGVFLGFNQRRWILLGAGALAVGYGLLWIRVVWWGKLLRWPEDVWPTALKNKLKIPLTALMVISLGTICWKLLTASEPSYGGRLLHVWLANFDLTGAHQPEKATEALRAIGTNALPLLTRMICTKDSRWKTDLMALKDSQSLIHVELTEAKVIRYRAVEGYHVLGPEAKSSVPALMAIMTSEPSAEVRSDVATALGWIGPDARAAIPVLLKAADDPNPQLHRSALFALANIKRWTPDPFNFSIPQQRW